MLLASAPVMSMKSTSLLVEPTLSNAYALPVRRIESVARESASNAGLRDWSARLAQLVGHASIRWGLTERQRHVLDLIARGKANKQVASTLGISERTVEVHIHNITVRARLHGRSEILAALLRDALESRPEQPIRLN